MKSPRRIAVAIVVLLGLLAAAGCVAFADSWIDAKDQENRDVECALRAPPDATYEVLKDGDGTLCIYRDEQGTVLKRVRVPG